MAKKISIAHNFQGLFEIQNVLLQNLSSDPAFGEGNIYANTGSHRPKYRDNSSYKEIPLSTTIVNTDIASGAAIAYSKLNLATSIVNADVSATAAIVYSKLNLATSIVNADIAAGAAIVYSKLNLTGGIVNADISGSAAIAFAKLASPVGTFDFNAQRLTNLGTPTVASDATTKAYVDSAVSGFDVKASVRLSSTANVSVTYTATGGTSARGQITAAPNALDGGSLALNDRILLKDQTTGAQNGIWVVTTVGTGANGVWDRATDFDQDAEVTGGAFTWVNEGTVNLDSGWVLTTNDPIIIGGASGTSLTWAQFTGLGQIVAGNGLTKTGNTLDVNVDNSTVEINTDILRVKDAGITVAKLATGVTLNAIATANATTSDVQMNTHKIIGLQGVAVPGVGADLAVATNARHVTESALAHSARVTVNANVTVSNPGTSSFDSVTLSTGDRILLTGQTSASENGLWIFNGSASAMLRPYDWYSGSTRRAGELVFVKEGTVFGGTFWSCASIATVDTNNGVFAQVSTVTGAAGGDLTGSYPNPTIAANAVTVAKLATSVTLDSIATAHAATAAITLSSQRLTNGGGLDLTSTAGTATGGVTFGTAEFTLFRSNTGVLSVGNNGAAMGFNVDPVTGTNQAQMSLVARNSSALRSVIFTADTSGGLTISTVAAQNITLGSSSQIKSMGDPTAAQDAATKAYVDGAGTSGSPFNARCYSAALSGTATSFTITNATHGLGANNRKTVKVLRETSGAGFTIGEVIDTDETILATGDVTVGFGASVTGSDYRINIFG